MFWKIVEGKWFWYLPPKPVSYDTPFGKMKPGADNPSGAPTGFGQGPTLAQLGQFATIDKKEISLTPASPSATATLSNKLPGKATLHIENAAPEGLDVQLDRAELNGGESAKLTVKLVDAAKLTAPPYTVRVRIDPLNQTFALKVLTPAPAKK